MKNFFKYSIAIFLAYAVSILGNHFPVTNIYIHSLWGIVVFLVLMFYFQLYDEVFGEI